MVLLKFQIPLLWRQFLAEILGTFLLASLTHGAVAQSLGKNEILNPLAPGLALMIGILASGGISGGHLNPAVTLALCLVKKCAWKRFPLYVAGQFLGAFIAASVLYGNHYKMIALQGIGTKGIFSSYPNTEANGGNIWVLMYDQTLSTAMLVLMILAVSDEKNMVDSIGLKPLFIGLGKTAIKSSFALNAGCSMNPAADLAPRIISLMIPAYNVKDIFGGNTDYFFWIPILMPLIGGPIGAIVYQFFIELYHPNEAIIESQYISQSINGGLDEKHEEPKPVETVLATFSMSMEPNSKPM